MNLSKYFAEYFYPKFLEGNDSVYSYYDSSASIFRFCPDEDIFGSLSDMERHLTLPNATHLTLLKSAYVSAPDEKQIINNQGTIDLHTSEGTKKYFFIHQIILKMSPIKIYIDTLSVINTDNPKARPVYETGATPTTDKAEQNQANDRKYDSKNRGQGKNQRGRGNRNGPKGDRPKPKSSDEDKFKAFHPSAN